MVSEEIGRGEATFCVTGIYIPSDVLRACYFSFLQIPGSIHTRWIVDVIWTV